MLSCLGFLWGWPCLWNVLACWWDSRDLSVVSARICPVDPQPSGLKQTVPTTDRGRNGFVIFRNTERATEVKGKFAQLCFNYKTISLLNGFNQSHRILPIRFRPILWLGYYWSTSCCQTWSFFLNDFLIAVVWQLSNLEETCKPVKRNTCSVLQRYLEIYFQRNIFNYS